MRLLIEGVRIAFSALWTNKLRTFLTLLGNIVGIMSVIAVVSLLGGIDRYIRREVASEGSNVFTIQRVNFFEAITDLEGFSDALRHNPELTRDDAAALRDRVSTVVSVGAKVSRGGVVSAGRKRLKQIDVRGRDAYYPNLDRFDLDRGRHFTLVEDRENAQVAVIGWDVYESLFFPSDPVGRRVKIGGRHFRVVGVGERRGTLFGQSLDRYVVVPIGAWRKVFGEIGSLEIELAAGGIESIDDAIEQATVVIRSRHGLHPGQENDFFVSTSDQLIDLWKSISRGVMVALVALVGISMVVGGIVLMNTMLVAVTERTREVGIRKALGARRLSIVWQFLVESATLSLVGGVVGMSIGFVVAGTVSALTVLPYTINGVIVAVAFVVTIVIGLVFGTYPALRAARLDPVEALRAE